MPPEPGGLPRRLCAVRVTAEPGTGRCLQPHPPAGAAHAPVAGAGPARQEGAGADRTRLWRPHPVLPLRAAPGCTGSRGGDGRGAAAGRPDALPAWMLPSADATGRHAQCRLRLLGVRGQPGAASADRPRAVGHGRALPEGAGRLEGALARTAGATRGPWTQCWHRRQRQARRPGLGRQAGERVRAPPRPALRGPVAAGPGGGCAPGQPADGAARTGPRSPPRRVTHRSADAPGTGHLRGHGRADGRAGRRGHHRHRVLAPGGRAGRAHPAALARGPGLALVAAA